MSGMLDRAAKAAREYMEAVDPDQHTADYLSAGVVRAVLLAIREPTAEMLQPACANHRPSEPISSQRDDECPMFIRRRRIWTGMVDVVLAQGDRP